MAEDAFYAPYLVRQDTELSELRTMVSTPSRDFPYSEVPGLSNAKWLSAFQLPYRKAWLRPPAFRA